jgi:hypothetical protein
VGEIVGVGVSVGERAVEIVWGQGRVFRHGGCPQVR